MIPPHDLHRARAVVARYAEQAGMTPDETEGWNAALDMIAAWLKKAIESEQEPSAVSVRVAWSQVLDICQSERK